MIKKLTISKLLGLSHLDMAMLMLVSKSQWSMFEIGQRSIPERSMQLLSEILAYVSAVEKVDDGRLLPSETQLKQQKEHIEYSLRENEHKQLKVAKKVAALEQKRTTQVKWVRLVGFFDSRIKEKEERGDSIHRGLVYGWRAALNIDHANALLDLELKQKSLKFEQSFLEKKLLNDNIK